MASLVHGPGTKEGMSADLPPRPTSPWECLADHIRGMPEQQLRRVAMLMLRVVCNWRLEDIGILFDLHKGHVCREADRARLEMSALLQEHGVSLYQPDPDPETTRMIERVVARITPFEKQKLVEMSTAGGISESKQARMWMLAGGLAEAMRVDELPSAGWEPDNALQAG